MPKQGRVEELRCIDTVKARKSPRSEHAGRLEFFRGPGCGGLSFDERGGDVPALEGRHDYLCEATQACVFCRGSAGHAQDVPFALEQAEIHERVDRSRHCGRVVFVVAGDVELSAQKGPHRARLEHDIALSQRAAVREQGRDE